MLSELVLQITGKLIGLVRSLQRVLRIKLLT